MKFTPTTWEIPHRNLWGFPRSKMTIQTTIRSISYLGSSTHRTDVTIASILLKTIFGITIYEWNHRASQDVSRVNNFSKTKFLTARISGRSSLESVQQCRSFCKIVLVLVVEENELEICKDMAFLFIGKCYSMQYIVVGLKLKSEFRNSSLKSVDIRQSQWLSQ